MKQITRLRGIALKLSPPIDVTIKRRCLEASHINSAHAPLNRDDGGLLPDSMLTCMSLIDDVTIQSRAYKETR